MMNVLDAVATDLESKKQSKMAKYLNALKNVKIVSTERRLTMSDKNTIVLCPVDGCKEVFDNRDRFTKHVTETHKVEEFVKEANYEEVKKA